MPNRFVRPDILR